jgi:hypothetical protein
MRLRFRPVYLIVVPFLCLLAVVFYNIPFIHERLAWRVDKWRTQIVYAINPPQEVEFVPQEQVALIVQATMTALARVASPTPTVSSSPTVTQPGPTPTPLPTATDIPTSTPLPPSVRLPGVKYEHQHNRLNYCGPANLSMALTFWGWDGNRDVVGAYVHTNDNDKNVMPYELQDFVLTQTSGLGMIIRTGGEISLLKILLANGFPVLAEKGYYTYDMYGKYGWLGHYQFITGYDDAKGVLVVQDTYIEDGENHEFMYDQFVDDWRPFDYLFMVVYPFDREAELFALLGNWIDEDWANHHALERAGQEVQTLTGIPQYFAAFNVGTSHVNLREYVDAAFAYDYAFELYAALPNDGLQPYRMLWYQTGPYFAYYYSGRYQDVITLANKTFDTIDKDVLEESFYWRGMARLAIGETDGAIDDFRESLRLHPGFAPSLYQLGLLGLEP